ncbi:MAG: aminopeptidase [Lachnospiraceae bacterium]|nr:aminopeptidase [Lachnospiraceae bacterium]MDD3616228.1 aminopeptidase [Lachnospiraceae bacterium]
MENKSLWNQYTDEQIKALENINDNYRKCLDKGKTERECVTLTIQMAEEKGYVNLETLIRNQQEIKPGDKIYAACMKKSIVLFQIGTQSLENGMNILGAHIDSPHMDVKQNPLYEDSDCAYLDTHYYGGIKKYQWVTTPLAIHGVVAKKDGTTVPVVIGEDDTDPVLVISDLLIHLSSEQLDKKAAKVVEGENLDVLVGNRPIGEGEEADKVKKYILSILKEKYGMEEADFLSAELEIVPAGKARECGIDRSMILAYGHDDRICAFTSLFAMLETENPSRTSCCLLVDKEEIGSVGATGMHSRFFENTLAEILALMGKVSELSVKRTLANSTMLSSDVSAAFDALYASVFEKKNSAYMGRGLVFNKYTGSRGKSGSNDARAEYIAKLRQILSKHNIQFQMAELGKVDAGGGGTIAYIMGNYGMDVIDCGIALLSMHAPYEVASKADIYETYRGYKAFLSDMEYVER